MKSVRERMDMTAATARWALTEAPLTSAPPPPAGPLPWVLLVEDPLQLFRLGPPNSQRLGLLVRLLWSISLSWGMLLAELQTRWPRDEG